MSTDVISETSRENVFKNVEDVDSVMNQCALIDI